jgi:predicted MFS family arabinose efflux permease
MIEYGIVGGGMLNFATKIPPITHHVLWLAIFTVVFIGSATSSVNTFITEYLGTVTNISGGTLTLALFLLGLASLLGNLLGGRFLTKNAKQTATIFPVILGLVLLLSFITGTSTLPMLITIMLWGILFAIGNNVGQYWVTSAAPEAPDFVNGLFLSCGNLGITIGTAVGGLFISGMGTQYIVFGGVGFLALSLVSILLRDYFYKPATKQLAS